MQLPPLEVIATWPKPNYVNPVTQGPSIVVVNVFMFLLAANVVAVRIYTRLRLSKSFGIDDIFILLAMVPAAATIIITLYTYHKYGGIRHVWDVELTSVSVLMKFSLTTQILFGEAVTLTKISMLLLIRRIMTQGSEVLRKIVICALIYVAASNICYTLVLIFQCKPISAWWTPSFTPQNCINQRTHLLIAGIQSITSDFLIVLIPIPVVLGLNIPARQRGIVVLLFSIGFCVCGAGIARTFYVYRLTSGARDITWDAWPVWVTGAVELYVGIICTSIPPTKAFFARYIPKILNASSSEASTITSEAGTTLNNSSHRSNQKLQLSDLTRSTISTLPPNDSSETRGMHGRKSNPRDGSVQTRSRGTSISSFNVSSERGGGQMWRNDTGTPESRSIGHGSSHGIERVDSVDCLVKS